MRDQVVQFGMIKEPIWAVKYLFYLSLCQLYSYRHPYKEHSLKISWWSNLNDVNSINKSSKTRLFCLTWLSNYWIVRWWDDLMQCRWLYYFINWVVFDDTSFRIWDSRLLARAYNLFFIEKKNKIKSNPMINQLVSKLNIKQRMLFKLGATCVFMVKPRNIPGIYFYRKLLYSKLTFWSFSLIISFVIYTFYCSCYLRRLFICF